MKPPPGYNHPPSKVYHLHKIFYGLKQAPRAWFSKFNSTINQFGFSFTSYDNAFFICKIEKGCIILLLYIDYIIIIRDDLQGITELIQFLSTQFEIKNLGHLSYFLGI